VKQASSVEALVAAAAAELFPEKAGADPVPALTSDVLDRVRGARRVLVFAGPGVVRARRVGELRRLAKRAKLGVVNSWRAKGIFDWRSPHHLGTVGLQAMDFELAGFADCDLIVATGIDEEETPRQRWALAPLVEVSPAALGTLDLGLRRGPIPRTLLFERLAAVVMPHYASTALPPPPGRRIRELMQRLGRGDMVAADPGTLAGFWLARAFPTSELGSVVVPARRMPGFAAAAALAGARRGRRVVGITTGPVDDTSRAVLEVAEAEGTPVELEVWGEGGLPVDWSSTAALIEVAGPVVAWGGLA